MYERRTNDDTWFQGRSRRSVSVDPSVRESLSIEFRILPSSVRRLALLSDKASFFNCHLKQPARIYIMLFSIKISAYDRYRQRLSLQCLRMLELMTEQAVCDSYRVVGLRCTNNTTWKILTCKFHGNAIIDRECLIIC